MERRRKREATRVRTPGLSCTRGYEGVEHFTSFWMWLLSLSRRSVRGVGVPELGFFFVVEEDAAVPDGLLGVGVVAGGVVAGLAGELAGGKFFAGALGSAIDVEPGGGTGVGVLLADLERVEGMGAGGVAQLPDERGDLVVGGFVGGGEGEAAVVVVEDLEGGWGRGGAWGIGGGWGWCGFGGGWWGGRGCGVAA